MQSESDEMIRATQSYIVQRQLGISAGVLNPHKTFTQDAQVEKLFWNYQTKC